MLDIVTTSFITLVYHIIPGFQCNNSTQVMIARERITNQLGRNQYQKLSSRYSGYRLQIVQISEKKVPQRLNFQIWLPFMTSTRVTRVKLKYRCKHMNVGILIDTRATHEQFDPHRLAVSGQFQGVAKAECRNQQIIFFSVQIML